jgi:hypothetical protein
MSILVESPSAATTFPDLHSPVIAVAGNCENDCNRSRHNHAAQISNEECAYHFISCTHFGYFKSNLAVVPIFYLAAINLKRLVWFNLKRPVWKIAVGRFCFALTTNGHE